jgi:hypothetical protein
MPDKLPQEYQGSIKRRYYRRVSSESCLEEAPELEISKGISKGLGLENR